MFSAAFGRHAHHVCRLLLTTKHMHAPGAGLRSTCGASLAGIKVDSGEQTADKENGDSADAGTAAAESARCCGPNPCAKMGLKYSSWMTAL